MSRTALISDRNTSSKRQTTAQPDVGMLPRNPSALLRGVRKLTEIVLARLPTGRWMGFLPFFPAWYTRQLMARRDHTGLHSGVYASYAEALAQLPASRLAGWDHSTSASLWTDNIDPVRPSTYPVLFWLSKLLDEDSQLVDVGGSIGLTYYANRRYSSMPRNATWTVVEVPKIAEQGAIIAGRENALDLQFTDTPSKLSRCDILLSAGAMQFMEHSLPGLLESLPELPKHILLNKLPVSPMPGCWTLQNYGPAITPMRLYNDREFLAYFSAAGYTLRDEWLVQDLDCLIPFHPERFIREFKGFLFERSR